MRVVPNLDSSRRGPPKRPMVLVGLMIQRVASEGAKTMRVRSVLGGWSCAVGLFAGCFVFGVHASVKADQESVAKVVLSGTVVDKARKPVAGVAVRTVELDESHPTKTAGDGSFHIEVSANPLGRIYTVVLARAADGRLGIFAVSQEKPEPVTVVLKPARALRVRVVNREAKPIEGADVGFLANFYLIFQGKTDHAGLWTQSVPADLGEWCVFARQAKTGFDYAASEPHRGPGRLSRALPDRVDLTLDGAA